MADPYFGKEISKRSHGNPVGSQLCTFIRGKSHVDIPKLFLSFTVSSSFAAFSPNHFAPLPSISLATHQFRRKVAKISICVTRSTGVWIFLILSYPPPDSTLPFFHPSPPSQYIHGFHCFSLFNVSCFSFWP